MSKKYWIYEVGNGPDPLGDAKNFEPFEAHKCWNDPDDALNDYLEECDTDSHFVDGYPQGVEYAVVDCEANEETRFIVNTEFEPTFCILDKSND